LTRYVPPSAWTHGSTRNSQREVIDCIWGTDLVVVASCRAAAVLRLWRSAPSSTLGSAESVTVTANTTYRSALEISDFVLR
jgi:hypothetical protein